MVASRTVGSRRETFKTIALAHFDTVWPGSHVSLKQRRTVSCVITVNHPVVLFLSSEETSITCSQACTARRRRKDHDKDTYLHP